MRTLLAVIAASLAGLVGLVAAPGGARAGGWGVISFDTAPVVWPGEPVELGFMFLRHGVTPESATDITFRVTAPDGTTSQFTAVPEGREGHHTVTIEVPEAGRYVWKATGMFVDIELGTFEAGSAATTGAGSSSWRWDAAQWGGTGLAVLLAAAAGAESWRSRRRGGSPVATPA